MSNYTSIGITVIVTYVAGSLYYLAIGKSWRNSLGWKEIEGKPYRPTLIELIIAFIGQLFLTTFMFWLLKSLNVDTFSNSLFYGFVVWLGLILPTLSTNVIFQRRNKNLIVQDGGHWLFLLLIISLMFHFLK